MKTNAAWSILHAEDDENDAFFVRRVVDKIAPRPNLVWAENGRDALGKLNSGALPDVVFLDINMPTMSGFELLAHLRQDPRFANVFVLMLSASSQPRDQQQAKQLGANGYIVKPNDWSHFGDRLEKILTAIERAPNASEWIDLPA